MRHAVVGSRGQLGTALLATLSAEVSWLDRAALDITDQSAVEQTLAEVRPDAVINAAAYNFVDRAEDEPEAAYAVNALGPRNLAIFCGARDIPLVHVSTDYVFSGHDLRQEPFLESDLPDPRSAYAVSKLAGEYYVRTYCPRHFILRTCGLYGHSQSEGKGNFITTMLRLAKDRDELRVVNDQQCTPTSVTDLAEWITKLMETESYGLYHATNSSESNWCDFAREIFRIADVDMRLVPISTEEFGAKAIRPRYSVLCCDKLQQTLGISIQSWQEGMAAYVSEIQ